MDAQTFKVAADAVYRAITYFGNEAGWDRDDWASMSTENPKDDELVAASARHYGEDIDSYGNYDVQSEWLAFVEQQSEQVQHYLRDLVRGISEYVHEADEEARLEKAMGAVNYRGLGE